MSPLLDAADGTGSGPEIHRREAVLVSVVVFGAFLVLAPGPYAAGTFGDDASYLALGRALAGGHGYRSLYYVGEPAHLKYPPAVPAIYALFWWARDSLTGVVELARVANAGALGIALGFLWVVARDRLGLGALLTLIFSVAPAFIVGALIYYQAPLSEPFLVLGWSAALLVSYRLRQASASGQGGRREAALLGAVLGATVLARSQGAVLIPAILAGLALWRIRLRLIALVGGVSVSPLLVLAGWRAMLPRDPILSLMPDETSYAAWFNLASPRAALEQVGEVGTLAFRIYPGWLAHYLSPWPLSGKLIVGLLFALAVAGAVRTGTRHAVVWTSALASLAVLGVWPWAQDRLLFPLLPFCGLLSAYWIHSECQRRGPRVRLGILAAVTILAGSVAARQFQIHREASEAARERSSFAFPAPSYESPLTSEAIRETATWLRSEARPEDRVLTRWPAAVYLLTGLKGLNSHPAEPWPWTGDPRGAATARRVLGGAITLAVEAGGGGGGPVALLASACPSALRPAGRLRAAVIFRVSRADPCLLQRAEEGGPSDSR